MSLEQYHEAPRANENRAIFNAYDPQTARSTTIHGTGYSLENANSELVSKGWVTNLTLADASGTGLLNQKKAYGIGPDNRAEGSESGMPKGGVGPDNRAADGAQTGMPKKGGVGPDNRAADGSQTGMPKKGGIGPDNRAADASESGMPKKSGIGSDNRAADASESGMPKKGGVGPNNRAVAGSEFGHKDGSAVGQYITMGVPIEQLKKV